jgi:phosphatidylserine/phosphatidylglycerophosphate/cardiolipin synthase-like enzyme
LGRRVRYPGWDLESRWRPEVWTEPAQIELAIAPDALHAFLRRHLDGAQRTLDLVAYTFDNPDLAEAVAARAAAGVRVRVLLDGSPAGGFDLTSRWCAATMAAAGASVQWLDEAGTVSARYRGAHAKLYLVDEAVAIVATENPGLGAAPDDDFSDGTVGRRGAAVAVRGAATVAWVRGVIESDLDPRHADVRPYQSRDPVRGAPAPDFSPPRHAGGVGYRPIALVPWTGTGTFTFEGVTAPENALQPGTSLFGLLARAGAGDRVFVAQLYERLRWGTGADGGPWINPRLEAYVAAARRGATVRILLDRHFDEAGDANSNHAAARWLNRLAAMEGLNLSARLGDPTAAGIHAKIVLVEQSGVNPAAWIHVGSLNGSETSNKANREVALQIEGLGPHEYLRAVLESDWAASALRRVHLPTLASRAWLRP